MFEEVFSSQDKNESNIASKGNSSTNSLPEGKLDENSAGELGQDYKHSLQETENQPTELPMATDKEAIGNA